MAEKESVKTGVLVISLILGIITAHGLFETPNVVGGGEAKMIAIIVLAVAYKAIIEFVMGRWRKRKHAKLSLQAGKDEFPNNHSDS